MKNLGMYGGLSTDEWVAQYLGYELQIRRGNIDIYDDKSKHVAWKRNIQCNLGQLKIMLIRIFLDLINRAKVPEGTLSSTSNILLIPKSIVNIYTDPLTECNLEGKATLVDMIDRENEIDTWVVQTLSDKVKLLRRIKTQPVSKLPRYTICKTNKIRIKLQFSDIILQKSTLYYDYNSKMYSIVSKIDLGTYNINSKLADRAATGGYWYKHLTWTKEGRSVPNTFLTLSEFLYKIETGVIELLHESALEYRGQGIVEEVSV